NKKHSPLCFLERLGRSVQVLFIARCGGAFSGVGSIQPQSVPDFNPSKPNCLERAPEVRRVFCAELEINQIGAIAQRHFENIGNCVEGDHDIPCMHSSTATSQSGLCSQQLSSSPP